MLIDTHAHLNFNTYKNDAPEVIRRSLDNNVWTINVGSQYSTSKRAVELAEKHKEGIYATVGLHPIYAGGESKSINSFPPSFSLRENSVFNYEKFKALAESPKVVAIGEIGLDYKSEYVLFKQKQKEVFLKQLDLAQELNLPVIFHCRMAHDDMIEILANYSLTNYSLTGVVHCFTGTWEQAKKYLNMGFYLGFNGIIFKLDLDEIIKKTPLDRILIETDCPYLIPPQETGRNEPIYVKYVAEKIAKIKKLSYKEIAQISTENAKKLFKI